MQQLEIPKYKNPNDPPLSKSQCNSYKQCPFKWYMQKVRKVDIPITPAALVKGVEIHDLLDKFYKPNTNNLKELIEIIKQDPKYEMYKDIMYNFIMFNKKYLSPDGGHTVVKPIARENKYTSDGLNFTGVVDVVHYDGKNYLMLDYKSGKAHALTQYRFELALYVYLFELRNPGKKITHWGIFFVEQNKLGIEPVDRKQIEESIAEVKRIRQKIREGRFEKTPGFLCRWCDMFQNGYCEGQ